MMVAQRETAEDTPPGRVVRVVGTLMVIYTVLSLPDAIWFPNEASWLARVVVVGFWLWYGWGVFNWTWTVSPTDVKRLNAIAAADDPRTNYRTLLVRNWLGWMGAIVAGRTLLGGGGWLLAIGQYFVLPFLAECILALCLIAVGEGWMRLRSLGKTGARTTAAGH